MGQDFPRFGGVRPGGQSLFLGLPHFRGSDHLHGLGYLGNILNTFDATFYLADISHKLPLILSQESGTLWIG